MEDKLKFTPELEVIKSYELDEETMAAAKKLLSDFDKFCDHNRLPYFAVIAVGEDGKETKYLRTGHTSYQVGVTLTNEEIVKHFQVANGAFLVYGGNMPEIQDSDSIPVDDIELENTNSDLTGDVKP